MHAHELEPNLARHSFPEEIVIKKINNLEEKRNWYDSKLPRKNLNFNQTAWRLYEEQSSS